MLTPYTVLYSPGQVICLNGRLSFLFIVGKKLKKLAHIVNPILVSKSSDLYVAQPITFETMRQAKARAGNDLLVTHYSAQYLEDHAVVPSDFQMTPDLDRSVLDVNDFRHKRKLPLLKDILDRLHFSAPDADYLIYTNVDIALQHDFYNAVDTFTNSTYDAFVINRRTIPGHYKNVEEIPLMMAEHGAAHRGWDCFIIKRDIYPRFKLFDVCIGASRVGLALLANMEAYANKFTELREEHLTFHIGDERNWLNPKFADYDRHNTKQLVFILEAIKADVGPLSLKTISGSFEYRMRTFGPLYEFWSRHVYLPVEWSKFLNRLTGRL